MLLLFSGCENSEVVQLDLKGTLKGKISTLDEFGFNNSDQENVVVQLDGSVPLISSITDSTGHYEMNEIPSGTYNLIISKEGYGENQRQGLQIVGGNEPIYCNDFIIEKSSTTIENLSLEIVNITEIYMKGIVNHNYLFEQGGSRAPAIRYFIDNIENPSYINYLQTGTFSHYGEGGSQIEERIYIDKNLLPSGSKIYVIAYGCYGLDSFGGYFDFLSNQYIYTSVGTESNIASITIP